MTIQELQGIVAEAMKPANIGILLNTKEERVEETVDLYTDSPMPGYRGMTLSDEGVIYVWDLYRVNDKWEFLAQPV